MTKPIIKTKRKHPTLWWVAKQARSDDVRIKEMLDWKFDIFKSLSDDDLVNNHRHTKDELLALWFVEVVENNNSYQNTWQEWHNAWYVKWVKDTMENIKPQYIDKKFTKDEVEIWCFDNQFREAIEKYLPNQDLIPLDVDKIIRDIQTQPSINDKFIKQILSKYGATTKKKFTKDEVKKWYNNYPWEEYRTEQNILYFLSDHWLLDI